jgi:hypothetical protein
VKGVKSEWSRDPNDNVAKKARKKVKYKSTKIA